jgi:cyclopropane fatty-acyl-phospholipid synthase-like methyltransferase
MSTAHFDKQAAEWDDNPGRVKNARNIAAAIKAAVPLSKTMSAMEFGCGTGLVSRELLPDIGKILAVDLSSGMIEQIQNRIAEDGLKNITAQCLDIFTNPPAGPFDLIFSAMAAHHVSDTDALLDRLAGLLAPGGYLALADLDTEDGTFHGEEAGPVHHGFSREELMQKLRERGLRDTSAVTAHTMQKNGRDYTVFLITARLLNGNKRDL